MPEYVLGVDGGGNKTHCALFDTEGDRHDLIAWGTTNHECLKGSFTELKDKLDKMMSRIIEKNGIGLKDVTFCTFGLAGVDTKTQHAIISDILKELGIKKFILCNDAYLGVKAGCKNGYGICAINGSGAVVAGVDPHGKMLQIGGQGDFSGDKGGGYYIGVRVVKEVYCALYKDFSKTIMTDMLFKELGIKRKEDLTDAVTEAVFRQGMPVDGLNRIAFEAANRNDRLAVDILEDIGKEYGKSVNGAIRGLDFSCTDSIEIVLAGSVFVKGENPTIINSLEREVLMKNPGKNFDIKILMKPPVSGAILWSLEGAAADKGLYEKVMAQF